MRRPRATSPLTLVLALALTVRVLAASPVIRAQETSPDADPIAASQPLELPAMALRPEDLGQPGFATGTGGFQSPEGQAAYQAAQTGFATADILETLTAIGYQQRYYLWLEQVTPASPSTSSVVAIRIETAITEFTNEAGAAAGFAYLEQTLEAATGTRDRPLITPIGDDAELTVWTGVTANTGEPYQALNLTFRNENLIGDVIVTDLTNAPVDQAQVEALASRLLARMAAVSAGDAPGLSTLVARPPGLASFDGYLVRWQRPTPTSDGVATDLAVVARSVPGASDVYLFRQALGNASILEISLSAFASAEDARHWLMTESGTPSLAQSLDVTDVTEIPDAPAVGEASRVFSYTLEILPATTVRGYVMVFQVEAIIARVTILSVPAAPLSAVMELGELQAACLELGRCPAPIAIPADLAHTEPGSSSTASWRRGSAGARPLSRSALGHAASERP